MDDDMPDPLPRWRSDRDLQTVMYCLWRRRAYIRSARLFADKDKWKNTLKDLGRLSADEMYETLEILGQGAGLKDAISNPDVPSRVRKALRSLLLCMSDVVGSNAHRTKLRHVNRSYVNMFGLPLIFTIANVPDTRSSMIKIMYEGHDICS